MNVAVETSVTAMQAINPLWRLWCLHARQIRSFGCIIVRDIEEGMPPTSSWFGVTRPDRA